MKPIIIISPNVNEDESLSLASAYIRAIELAGGIPLILTHTEDSEALEFYLDISDGVLLSGGGDISTTLYGEDSGEPIPERDIFELGLLGEALKRKKPVMAICRGLQLVNVYFGGTLIEDIPSTFNTNISHRQTEGAFEYSHSVDIVKGTPLHSVLGLDSLVANSFHHQAIDRIGEGLIPVAFAKDGIIEAVYAPNERYLAAYQWHPERLSPKDSNHLSLFKNFIKECEK